MPPPRAVAKSLRKTALAISKVPDKTVADSIEAVVARAIDVGGTIKFGGRRYPLFAEAKVSKRGGAVSALIYGVPAGAWAIKSNGRGASVDRRGRRAMPIGPGVFRASSGPARGDDRWNLRVADWAEEEFPEVGFRKLDEAIENG